LPVYVYQTFVIKQENFEKGIDNLREIKKFRNENYDHQVEILTPISGQDHTFAILSTYEGLAEMELQSKKMVEDEEYVKLIGDFFLKNIAENSMNTQIYRSMSEKKREKK
jgi:hypothetical protein